MTGKANRLPYFFLGGPDCRYSVMIGTAGAGGGPLRSESARRLTPEIRQSKFPGTPRPSVTLALAAPGPPVQLRWTTLRVQGPTLRDAALANGGHGSPPVAPRLLPQPRPRLVFHNGVNLTAAGEVGVPAKWSCHFAGWQRAPSSAAAQSATWSQAVNSSTATDKPQTGSWRPAFRSGADGAAKRGGAPSHSRREVTSGLSLGSRTLGCICGSWRYSLWQARAARI